MTRIQRHRAGILLTGGLAAFVALSAAAVPAYAHDEINPKRITVGEPAFLSLTAANEQPTALTDVIVTAPEGVELGETTRPPAGWTAKVEGHSVTFASGRVPAHQFETFGFEVEGVDQPGALDFTVALRFSDGETERATVEVTAVAGDAVTTPTTPATGTTEPPVASASSAVVSVTPATTAVAASAKDSTARSRGNTALLVGGAGALLGLLALVVALTRGRSGAREL
jgi:hypothetical protein